MTLQEVNSSAIVSVCTQKWDDLLRLAWVFASKITPPLALLASLAVGSLGTWEKKLKVSRSQQSSTHTHTFTVVHIAFS